MAYLFSYALHGIFSIVSLGILGLFIYGIVLAVKKIKQRKIANWKKSLILSVLSFILSAIIFILNPGWFRVMFVVSMIPFAYFAVFAIVNLFASSYARESRAIRVMNLLYMITYAIMPAFFPDFGDIGGSYCFFTLVRDGRILAIVWTVFELLFVGHLSLLVAQIIVMRKLRKKEQNLLKEKEKSMVVSVYPLWDFECENENPVISHYRPEEKISDWTVLVLAGGGYELRADHEGKGYAEFLNAAGINAFVVDYRVNPCFFPAPLLDARRAMRFVRKNAEQFGVNPDKIAIMGSSAGGHLAATLSTYLEPLAGEEKDDLKDVPFLPNAQILCYPVIHLTEDFGHVYSGHKLLGEDYDKLASVLSPDKLVTESTPKAFIWHTFSDNCVPVKNSFAYAGALEEKKVPVEFHIFPEGDHGLGLADEQDTPVYRHVAQWSGLLLNWIKTLG